MAFDDEGNGYANTLDALVQAKSTDRGHSFTPARPVAMITGVNSPFEGQASRNLAISTTGVDRKGRVCVAVQSSNASGAPVTREADPDELKHVTERLEREQERPTAGARSAPTPTGKRRPPTPRARTS
jgi:hypothetical protein